MNTGIGADAIVDKDEREARNDQRDRGYPFPNNPVAKSSTNVLQASVCQRCGCKLDGKTLTKRCDCKCHTSGPIVRR